MAFDISSTYLSFSDICDDGRTEGLSAAYSLSVTGKAGQDEEHLVKTIIVHHHLPRFYKRWKLFLFFIISKGSRKVDKESANLVVANGKQEPPDHLHFKLNQQKLQSLTAEEKISSL